MLPNFLRRLPLFALAGLSLLGLPAIAATLTVPAQYPTIQAAVSAASNGDTVLIADGTYTGPGNVDIDFGGKNLTVTSQNGAAKTIIDCGGSSTVNHRGFYLHTGETNAVISGLTIENGEEGGSYPGSNNYPGGGIYNLDASLTLQNCIIRNNIASQGGGLYNSIYRGTVLVTNCVFSGNTASSGSAYADNSEGGITSFVNCTITGNTATGNTATGSGGAFGGAINTYDHPYPLTASILTLTNDIVYGDTGGEVVNAAAVNAAANNCDIQGGYPGTGDIAADPLFFSSAALHLQFKSPCLGAGTASGAPAATIDGQSRPNPPSIGAYEAAPSVTWYVSPSDSDSSPGTAAAPKQTIQAAITAAASGDTVVATDGTYTGPGDVDLEFGGKNITVTSQHGASATIIDCQGSTSANHRGFYLHSGETNAVIGGLTIENGYESSTSGGGILINNAGVTVQNCVLKGNTADYGGGIYSLLSSTVTVTIVNCVLTGNAAISSSQGGGIANYTQTAGTISVINCTIAGNTATSTGPNPTGGGVTNYSYPVGSSLITFTNDILFRDNSDEVSGGNAVFSFCDIQGGYSGTGNLNADPAWAYPPYDLHLLPGSPCLGAGTAIGAPALTIDGRTRPNPPSIGAYEVYVAPTVTLVANASGTAGQIVTLNAALNNSGAAVVSGKTLSFSVDGAAVGSAVTDSTGNAALLYTIPAAATVGGHALGVSFTGDMTLSASSGTGTLTVAAAPVFKPVQINAGGGASGAFTADTDFSGGRPYAASTAISTSGAVNPAPQAVYQSERYGSFTYTVPNLTPGAAYTLRLHFAEIYWNAAGKRVFNVAVNKTTVLSNFDIFVAANGKNKAIVKTFSVKADASGKVTVVFTTVKDNAKLSGLELLH